MTEVIEVIPFEETPGPSLISRCASEINPEPIEWLWCGRIARGKHTCIAGEPGTGKSQLTMAMIATITMGGHWPCDEGRAPQGSVILLSAEDGAADTIVPRLDAAGADRGRVQIVSAVRERDGIGRRAFNLQADLALLEKEIERVGDVALVVIDPVSSYLGKTDSHKNAEVRGVLEPIGEMAERLRVAILSVTHFSKSGAGAATKALHRFIGSIAFVGAPRAAFAVIEDPEDKDRRLFLHAKNKLAAPPQGLAFTLKETIVGDPGKKIVASRIVWEADPVSVTANEALAAETANSSNHSALEEAKSFLEDFLFEGPVAAKETQEAAKANLISPATLRRAKAALGLRVTREGFGPGSSLRWSLSDPIDAHVPGNEHLWEKSQKTAKVMSTYDEHLCGPIDAHLPSIDAHRNGGKPIDAQILDVSTNRAGEHLCAVANPEEEFPDLPAFLDRRVRP